MLSNLNEYFLRPKKKKTHVTVSFNIETRKDTHKKYKQ